MVASDGRVYKLDLDRAPELGDSHPEVIGFAGIGGDPFEAQGAEGRGQQQVRGEREHITHGVFAPIEAGTVDRAGAVHDLETAQGRALGKTKGEAVDQDVEHGEAMDRVPGGAIAGSRSQHEGAEGCPREELLDLLLGDGDNPKRAQGGEVEAVHVRRAEFKLDACDVRGDPCTAGGTEAVDEGWPRSEAGGARIAASHWREGRGDEAEGAMLPESRTSPARSDTREEDFPGMAPTHQRIQGDGEVQRSARRRKEPLIHVEPVAPAHATQQGTTPGILKDGGEDAIRKTGEQDHGRRRRARGVQIDFNRK